ECSCKISSWDYRLFARSLAEGGSATRGPVTVTGYVARTFGGHSAMPSFTFDTNCAYLIFLSRVTLAFAVQYQNPFEALALPPTDFCPSPSMLRSRLASSIQKSGVSSMRPAVREA